MLNFYASICKHIFESVPVGYMQNALILLHSWTNLSWWATIVLATLLIRTIIFPLMIYQHYILAKLENLKIELVDIARRLKKEMAYNTKQFHWTESYAKDLYMKSLRDKWKMLVHRENCHPLKAAAVLVIQLPVWVIFSLALRNIYHMLPVHNNAEYETYMQFTTGGFGWMMNLTEADPSFLLPLLFGLSKLLAIEMQYTMNIRETKVRKYLPNLFRVLIIILVPPMAFVPSCLTLFWATSSVTGLFHNIVLLSPKIRRLGGVPKTNTELQYPYTELYRRIQNRFRFKEKPGSRFNV